MTRAGEIGSRAQTGYGYGHSPTGGLSRSHWSHSNHTRWSNANETSDSPPAMAIGIAALRHSRRNTNQSSPTPIVGLVSSGIAHRAGQRKPRTITTAIGRLMFAALISEATGVRKISAAASAPVNRNRPEHQ